MKYTPKKTSNHGGGISQCVKCGCVKEYVKGIPTYFIDDNVYDKKAPQCDERFMIECTCDSGLKYCKHPDLCESDKL